MTSKRLNPWFEAKEWDYVKGLVLARDIKALDFFQVIMLDSYFGIVCCNCVSVKISNKDPKHSLQLLRTELGQIKIRNVLHRLHSRGNVNLLNLKRLSSLFGSVLENDFRTC